jgi:hypothetical protein
MPLDHLPLIFSVDLLKNQFLDFRSLATQQDFESKETRKVIPKIPTKMDLLKRRMTMQRCQHGGQVGLCRPLASRETPDHSASYC